MAIEWFPGSIEEAIEKCNADDRVLITFIDGLDKSSAILLKYLSEPTTCAKIQANRIKIIKISANSEDYKKLSESYKALPVPAIFFLDQTGRPLGLITSDIASAAAMERKFDFILAKRAQVSNSYGWQNMSNLRDKHKVLKKEEISSDEDDEQHLSTEASVSTEVPAILRKRNQIQPKRGVERPIVPQRPVFLAGGQDLRVNEVLAQTTTNNQESRLHEGKTLVETLTRIPGSISHDSKDLPRLANLIIHFDNGEIRGQHFAYNTSFGVVRRYIWELIKKDRGNYSFYISTPTPYRILAPELDKTCLEDLGLYPVAELEVHMDQTLVATHPRPSLISRLGGLPTILGVALWVLMSPVLIGTDWCRICNLKSTITVPSPPNAEEVLSNWMYNALQSMPAGPS